MNQKLVLLRKEIKRIIIVKIFLNLEIENGVSCVSTILEEFTEYKKLLRGITLKIN